MNKVASCNCNFWLYLYFSVRIHWGRVILFLAWCVIGFMVVLLVTGFLCKIFFLCASHMDMNDSMNWLCLLKSSSSACDLKADADAMGFVYN
jgi:hypothetical protein